MEQEENFMNNNSNETEVIHTAQPKDLDTFNDLILQYQDFLFRVASRVIRDEDQACDVLQDACLLAFRKLASFRGGSFRNWLARIVVNICYDELRRQRRHPIQPLEPTAESDNEMSSPYWLADYSTNPEVQCELNEFEQTIQSCLKNISPDHRAVIVLIDMEELSYEEAADILEIPTGTIKSRLARARAQMRGVLQMARDTMPACYQIQIPAYSRG
jgi:RNA polymerase sigma-70 factor (ECF subfamily)